MSIHDLRRGDIITKIGEVFTNAYPCDSTGKDIGDSSFRRRAVAVPIGATGTYIERTGGQYLVVYMLGDGSYARVRHADHKYGQTWIRSIERTGSSSSGTFTIVNEGITELFKAQSTEVINGVVPQVKYGESIVWQGDPVASTDNDGKTLSLTEQHDDAIKVAADKITEVVKKQFQG